MKKYSMLGVAIHHPLKTLLRTIVIFIVLVVGLALLDFNLDDDSFNILLAVSIILSAYTLKRRYNKGNMASPRPKRKRNLLFGMFGLLNHMNSSVDRQINAMGNAVGDAFINSFSGSSSRTTEEAQHRARRQQADAAARARWDALDRQKKAEWDARDAALRGRDRAANQYQNQADYWCRQGKR